jgi:hypothetical protein
MKPAHDTPDPPSRHPALTVLRTCGPLATTRVRAGPAGPEIVGYDRAKHFAAREESFDGLDGLHRLLLRQDRRPREFVVRAALRPGVDPRRVRRKIHADPATGEASCFVAEPRAWAAFDFDGVPAPACLDPVREPIEAGMLLRDLLPERFAEAGCIVQATSSCGLRPGLRYRLWFVLDRPLHGHLIEAWCARPDLDPSTLHDIEPIYVGRPLFEGVPDPVPRRIVLLEGVVDVVEVPDPLPTTTPGRPTLGGGPARPALGFDGWVRRMGDGPGLEGFRRPIVSALAAYVRRHGVAGLRAAADTLRDRLVAAAAAAPRRPGRGPDVDRYLSDRHIAELVGWFVAVETRRAAVHADAVILAALVRGNGP